MRIVQFEDPKRKKHHSAQLSTVLCSDDKNTATII